MPDFIVIVHQGVPKAAEAFVRTMNRWNEIKFDGKYSGENGGRIKIEIWAKETAETLKTSNN